LEELPRSQIRKFLLLEKWASKHVPKIVPSFHVSWNLESEMDWTRILSHFNQIGLSLSN